MTDAIKIELLIPSEWDRYFKPGSHSGLAAINTAAFLGHHGKIGTVMTYEMYHKFLKPLSRDAGIVDWDQLVAAHEEVAAKKSNLSSRLRQFVEIVYNRYQEMAKMSSDAFKELPEDYRNTLGTSEELIYFDPLYGKFEPTSDKGEATTEQESGTESAGD